MRNLMQKLLQSYKRVIYWLGVILLLVIPLYFKFPLYRVGGTFVSIRLEDVLIFVSLAALFGYLILSKDYKKLIHDKLFLAFLLFFLIGFLSVISASFITQTVTLKLAIFHWARRLEIMLLFYLGYYSVFDKKSLKSILGIMLLVLFLVNFYALGQKYFHFPSISTTNAELSKGIIKYIGEGDRVNSTFAGHYDLAIYLMMAITLLTPILIKLFERIRKNPDAFNVLTFLVLVSLTAVSFAVLVMTAARLSFFALFFGLLAALLLIGQKKYLLVAAGLAILVLIYPSQLRNRLVSTFTVNFMQNWSTFFAQNEGQKARSMLNIQTLPNAEIREVPAGLNIPDIVPGEPTNTVDLGVYRSMTIRTRIEWPRALRALSKNPLLGTGYSSIGLATDNDYLRLLGEVGLMGFWAFTLILVELGKRLFALYKSADFKNKKPGLTQYLTVGVLAMLLAFIVNGLFIDVFEASKVASLLWMTLGIVLKANEV